MTLQAVDIVHLRNLTHLRTALHPHLNIISGPNGSGKTSFLEAIYLLSCAKSFRTRELASLITHGESHLTIYGKTIDDQTLAIRKSLSEPTILRLNHRSATTPSDTARFLPTQVFYQDIFQIIDSGPSVRRSVLDWGLFHVKHDYYDLWKNYRRALKQRNSLLRIKAKPNEFVPWNKILSELSSEIHLARVEYVQLLNVLFNTVLQSLGNLECQLQYDKGWDKRAENKTLEMILTESLNTDLQYQYTRYGCHQAEILFTTPQHKLKHYFSRGQQKMVLFALKLAQAQLVKQRCVFLMDDILAELDQPHIAKLMECILASDGQFFMTCHDSQSICASLTHDAFSQLMLPLCR